MPGINLPQLMLITDRKACDEPLSIHIENACQAGIRLIQLREKDLPGKLLLEEAETLREITKRYGAKLIINDRADVALLSGADGVHLPESGLSIPATKTLLEGKTIGKSTHSLETALEASREGADYMLFGPIFDTPSKRAFGLPQGLKKLTKLCANVSCPVFAVGGITPERAQECLQAGAYGVAAIRIFMSSQSIKNVADAFNKEIQS
jgi:thiamine-phosphate pyrophosphorylase